MYQPINHHPHFDYLMSKSNKKVMVLNYSSKLSRVHVLNKVTRDKLINTC